MIADRAVNVLVDSWRDIEYDTLLGKVFRASAAEVARHAHTHLWILEVDTQGAASAAGSLGVEAE